MVHHKLQPMKSKIFYRLIPTLMFIMAISAIVLTMFFMLVLQSRNAYELDGDDPFSIVDEDFKMAIDGATSDQIANLDIDDISFEDNTNTFTSTQPPPPSQQNEMFLLKKTINPATNNHIHTDNNLQSMKAYKIVSKKPIIANSLVKIVMAPQNVLEKLSRQQERNNGKYDIDTIDTSGNVPIKEHGSDDISSRELIQNGNGNGNANVEVFSLEDEGNIDFVKTTQPQQNVLDHDFNNIQIIAKTYQQPLNMISMENQIPFNFKVHDVHNRNEIVAMNEPQSVEVEMESMEIIPENESTHTMLPVTTEAMLIDSTYTNAEELLSNPTTSQNLIPTLIPEPEDIKTESVEVSTEINASTHRIDLEDAEHLPMTSPEISAENSTPMVVLKILKNRTVLIEEIGPQPTPDQLGMEMTSVPKIVTPTRPKKKSRPSTTTTTPVLIDVKQPQFPKKATFADSYKKHKNIAPKLDDVSFELTPKTSLMNIETTEVPSLTEPLAKSKNTKRAVGDEGSFASNIVRPSPIRPKKIGDLFPRETERERAERLSKSMQRLMHFVTIAGHVDSYLTKRVRNGLKNVARIFDSVEDARTRRRRRNDF